MMSYPGSLTKAAYSSSSVRLFERTPTRGACFDNYRKNITAIKPQFLVNKNCLSPREILVCNPCTLVDGHIWIQWPMLQYTKRKKWHSHHYQPFLGSNQNISFPRMKSRILTSLRYLWTQKSIIAHQLSSYRQNNIIFHCVNTIWNA